MGVDVDDVRYHGSALNPANGEMLQFHYRPTMKGLVEQLERLPRGFGTIQMKLCYKASYVGFSLDTLEALRPSQRRVRAVSPARDVGCWARIHRDKLIRNEFEQL